jgi:CHAT domain-containing protein/uncharacterized protein HemY
MCGARAAQQARSRKRFRAAPIGSGVRASFKMTTFSLFRWMLSLLTASVLMAQTQPQILELGKTIAGELAEGRSDRFTVNARAGQFLRVVVLQPDVATVVRLTEPRRKETLVELHWPGNAQRREPLYWIAKDSGNYSIELVRTGQIAAYSKYEITLEVLRLPVPGDQKQVEAQKLFEKARARDEKRQSPQAIAAWGRALLAVKQLNDRDRHAAALSSLAKAYKNSIRYERAIVYYEQALLIRRQMKDRAGERDALNSVGNNYYNLSHYGKAIGYYERALVAALEIKDRRAEGATLMNIGDCYARLGQDEKAIGYIEQALAIAREIKDSAAENIALSHLGSSYDSLSQYEKAVGYYQQALSIAREIKDRDGENTALANLGGAYWSLSQFEKASGYLEQALANAREIKDRGGEGVALERLGSLYASLGQHEKAIGYIQQALVIARETRDRDAEDVVLNNLGDEYNDLGQHKKAIAYLEQSLAIAREIKDRDTEGLALANLGESYNSLGQYKKAIVYLEPALAISREVKDRDVEGETLNSLGNSCNGLNQYKKATAYYDMALAIAREVKDPDLESNALSRLMGIWRSSGKLGLAIFYGKQAVNTIQSVRSGIRGLHQDLQKSFLKDNEKSYHTLAELLMAQGRLAEAEQVLALLKEEEYFQYIRRDASEAASLNRHADLTSDEADWEKRYREIGDQLMAIGTRRSELLAKRTPLNTDETRQLEQIDNDLSVGNRKFEQFLGDLSQHFSAKVDAGRRIEDLRETQGIMEDLRELPAGTVAIYTLIGEDKFHAILRTPDAQKAFEYPITGVDLNRKILEFREVVRNPTLDPRPLAQELYKILVAGMAEDLRQANARTLMWSLDGALRYVPLAALYDGKQYLVEQYRVSVMTLASNSRLKDRPDREWKAAGFGVSKAFEGSSALPSVSSELAGIITTQPGDHGILSGEIKLDGQFTLQTMRQTLLKRYPVVHIASHFRFQPGNDTNSFLLLGDGGHMSLAELKTSANLFGGVQLLTLSACNTGVGDGTEVEGFGALAQRQGAKAVIASLWPVADESTSLLMQEFYRIRESTPETTKAEALRQAQLSLLRGTLGASKDPIANRSLIHESSERKATVNAPKFQPDPKAPYAHPYFWAPFFLMGNWL